MPRGHLRSLLAEYLKVGFDLIYSSREDVRADSRDERFGCSIGDRPLLLRDQRIDTRDLRCGGIRIAGCFLAAGSKRDQFVLVGDQLVNRLPHAHL
jgi:hypothetical protein